MIRTQSVAAELVEERQSFEAMPCVMIAQESSMLFVIWKVLVRRMEQRRRKILLARGL